MPPRLSCPVPIVRCQLSSESTWQVMAVAVEWRQGVRLRGEEEERKKRKKDQWFTKQRENVLDYIKRVDTFNAVNKVVWSR
eukprot:761666-Hanusia_phi.AAC.2